MSNLMRVGSNIQAMQALRMMEITNAKLGDHQYRLASGKRINTAQDDTAGYAIGKTLESRKVGLQQAFKNVGNAKNILNIAQGGYQAQMTILQDIKAKVSQASDDSIDTTQRQSIDNMVRALMDELDDISNQTKWNGESIIDGGSNSTFNFQVGADAEDSFLVTLDGSSSTSIGGAIADGGIDINVIDLITSSSTAAAAMTTIDAAIEALSASIQESGNYLVRLSSKEESISVSITNTEAARSRIEDADFADEQMEMMKLQILQQTGISSLSQANAAPQAVLSLFQ